VVKHLANVLGEDGSPLVPGLFRERVILEELSTERGDIDANAIHRPRCHAVKTGVEPSMASAENLLAKSF